MERKTAARRLAWSLWVLTLAVLSFSFLALLSYGSRTRGDIAFMLVFGLVTIVNAAVGALIASRNPRNCIGWAFCTAALGIGLAVFGGVYARARVRP